MHHDRRAVLFADRRDGSVAGTTGRNPYGWIARNHVAAVFLLRVCRFCRVVLCDIFSPAARDGSYFSSHGFAPDLPSIWMACGLAILSRRRIISHSLD